MKVYRERSYVVCHMLSSIDGKIGDPYYAAPEMGPVREESLKVRESYHCDTCDAVLNGTVTYTEIDADGYIDNLSAPDVPCPRTDYIADTDVKQMWSA